MSKYKVSWLILLPEKGKATKREVSIINKKCPYHGFGIIGLDKYMIGGHFPSKKEAEKCLPKIKGLGKPYRAYIITDAQFGSMKIDHATGLNSLFITGRQKKASKIIK
ncbi:MAG: hypothetical protein PF448_08820 [Bacteroidales bacterium]|jgi:hypothetical protein|nr:hypothetical protein [Bacteroidales bacterium]